MASTDGEIEHYAEHIGQMRLTRQLWEARDR